MSESSERRRTITQLQQTVAALEAEVAERKRIESALRASEAQLATELADMQLIQRINSQLIEEGNFDALYQQILDAAIAVMRSDMGSMQMLYPDRNELRLLAWKGFAPASAAFWEWVRVDSGSTCGVALTTGERALAPDVETCDFMVGTEDLDFYRLSGIKAVQSTPLISRSGRLVGMISTHWREPHQPAERELRLLDVLARQAADLIERKRTDEASAHLAAIVTSADDAIVSKTLDGIVTSWNSSAERMFGYTAEEMIGKTILRIIPPDRHDEENFILASLRAGERVEHFETVRMAKDGRLLEVSLTISPVRDNSGAIIGASKIARDITERKRTEEALQEANQRMDEFLHTATHELKTPLTALQANLQLADRRLQRLLAATPDGPPRTSREALESVTQLVARNQQQVRRLTRLVNDLVDAARVQAGKLEIRSAPCDLAEIVWEAVTEQRAVRPEREIHIEHADGLEAPLRIEADADRLGQVVTNYLTNALKYSPDDRAVEVTLCMVCDGARVARVAVRDEGPGIPAQEQKRIWERGHRVAGIKPTGEGVGLGLGLYISRQIVEGHGGRVGLESAPGAGSTFWFEVPLPDGSVL
ncbi:MAG TPA: PAS domain S-box protein [Ktedonobacterales bacterium]|nr:PAS domain S-box protein [Ktedonobacterales bacterium]